MTHDEEYRVYLKKKDKARNNLAALTIPANASLQWLESEYPIWGQVIENKKEEIKNLKYQIRAINKLRNEISERIEQIENFNEVQEYEENNKLTELK